MSLQYETPRAVDINTLLTWIKDSEIAIPEIQRPFVWKPVKVRDLLDSLFKGYPIGFMIVWLNPNVKLKDGKTSSGKRILIDGQQRITALMAAISGHEIVTKKYTRRKIRIAYHPIDQKFEVSSSVIRKDPTWIPDISEIFSPTFKQHRFVNEYCKLHGTIDPDDLHESISALLQIKNNTLGLIELSSSLEIETVTEIFIRVNSKGVPLSQSDFAMSKIAVNEKQDGTLMRKAIDYFCHLAVNPSFYTSIEKNDKEFAQTEYFKEMAWLRKENDDLYDPSYADMLRVTFTSQFRRGKLGDLVALLSGRNFETREYEEIIVEATFTQLREGIMNFMNETNFNRFLMIIKSAGFINSSLIRSQTALNFAYILYLTMRNQRASEADIIRNVSRWYVMSVLTGRYSGSAESTIDQDIRLIDQNGIEAHADTVIRGELSDAFWETTLPQSMITSSINSPYFHVYRAAQIKLNDKGFFSRDIPVSVLIEHKSDVHHIFPSDLLKKNGMVAEQYNQIANYVITQTDINIKISNKAPSVYSM